MVRMTEITQEQVQADFRYEDGRLFRNNPKSKFNYGKPAAQLSEREGHPKARLRVFWKGERYQESKLIYLLHYGTLPEVVDHINGDQTDNHIENLRAATHLENSYNRKISKLNAVGFKGVSWDAHSKLWAVHVSHEGKNVYKKRFKKCSDAVIAYDIAAIKYHGKFAKTNFPREDYE